MRELDALDEHILASLQRDARLSGRAIAREHGVAAGTVNERISRLEDSGVITGYSAVVDRAKLGEPLRFVVGLQITHGQDLDDVLNELAAIPEVEEVLVVAGQWDLFVHCRVRNPEHLNEVLVGQIWKSPTFQRSETMLVIRERRT